MDPTFFERIRESLLQQRKNITGWLEAAPLRKRQINLGPEVEDSVRMRLQVLDSALEKSMDGTLGLCEVCHEYIENDRLLMDYTSCVCLTHLSEAEQSKLESELELATKVQRALLPRQAPDIPGMQVAAFSRPAAIVGGDYFDFFHYRDDAHGLAIGDVAGHGMSASLLMASLQASLRTLAPDHDTPAEVVRRLNLLFCHNINLSSFVSLFLARFEPATLTLRYCNAGHNPPLLLRAADGMRRAPELLRPTGAAIGLVEDSRFTELDVQLVPGDLLLLYTDGATEAMNSEREEFGMERLTDILRSEPDWQVEYLIRTIRRELEEFCEGRPLSDDTTVVACKVPIQ